MKAKGTRLEMRVISLLKTIGKFNVQHSVTLIDGHGHRSEIDIIYGYLFKTYIECKNYSGPVPLEAVAKFKEVLALNGVPAHRGVFVTNSYYTPRATRIGIRCIDGTKLAQWERQASMYVWTRRIVAVWLACSILVLGYGENDVVDRLVELWNRHGVE